MLARRFDHVFVVDARAGSFPPYYVPDAFLFSTTYGMIPKDSAGDALAARTAKFTWYEHHAKPRAAYVREQRRVFAAALGRADRTVTVSAGGRPTRGVAAPELASEVAALLTGDETTRAERRSENRMTAAQARYLDRSASRLPPAGTLDAATALQPYAGPFGTRHAAHLLRRGGFGGSESEVARTAALGAAGAVDGLLHPTEPDAGFAAYPDVALLYDRAKARASAQLWWLDRMLRTKRPLSEKMTLFWHGHFATSVQKVPAPAMVAQIDLFRQLGLGRFPALLSAVTRDPAMLIWLDNRANAKAHPNENYAREVMELFALGLGNYTEDDVKEAARAFTGWTIDKDQRAAFVPARHDDGIKTVLGKSGRLDADDVVAIVVSQPVHQRFIARKLLEFFVYSDPEPELTESLAQTYALSGFDLAKTVGTMLRSNVFYSSRAYRAIPKSSDRVRDRHAALCRRRKPCRRTWCTSSRAWARNRSTRRASRAGTAGRHGSTPRRCWRASTSSTA